MTQRNFVLQFFDELRVLIGRSFAEASGRGFGQVFASDTALMKNGQFLGAAESGNSPR